MVTVVLRQRDRLAPPGGGSDWTKDGDDRSDNEDRFRRWQLPSVGGETVDVALEGADPPWLAETLRRCADLLQLRDGWNSYDARPINPAAVAAALQLLVSVMAPETPAPLLIPTNRGSISLEWHMHGIDLEVRIVEPDQLDVYLDDQVSGREWEAVLRTDLAPLAEILSELAARAQSAGRPAD